MSEAVRDCGEIWSRLFDHRPFLNGELKFMLREFEEKRNDREIENLFSAIENVTEIKDNQIERFKKLTENVALLDEVLKVANIEAKEVLKVQEKNKGDTFIENRRALRKQEWRVFIDDIKEKYTRIDNAFEQKEEELKDLYTDLEHKLNISTK